MLKKVFLILIFFATANLLSKAQELNCNIQVVANSVQGTETQVYETLKESLYEFMNSRRWTNYSFNLEERIECTFLITITEKVSSDRYKASLQVQARRPVFNSAYNSAILNLKDNNFEFDYVEYQPIVFNENSFESNLTSVLAFYAYMIIGFDFDTFSPMGGTPFYNKAQTVINNAQSSAFKGWKSIEDNKNRYWFLENVLNSSYTSIRECLYKYHRLGLDQMSESTDNAKKEIITAIELLRKTHRSKPGSYLMQIFFDAKADEIVNIFSEASSMEVGQIKNTLNEIDPANSTKYNNIGKPK